MLTFQIPLVTPAAGALSDGALRGQINESIYLAAVLDVRLAPTTYVVRKDATGGGQSFSDLTTVANNDAVNDVIPWDSVGDKLYVGCEQDVQRIYVRVDTSALSAGAGLDVRYSSGGIYDDTLLTGVSDGTAGFSAAPGVYAIDIPWPADAKSWSPQPGSPADVTAGRAVASRKWLVLEAKTPGAQLGRIWLHHVDSAVVYTDVTANQNAATSPAPARATATIFPVVDEAVYFCSSNPALGAERYIYEAQANNRRRVLEYRTGGGWSAFSGVSDPSNDLQSGPVAYMTTPQRFRVRWTVPSDWASAALTFGSVTATGYWYRIRTTAVTSYGPMQPPTVITRPKQFGTANTSGDLVSAMTAKRITLKRRGAASGSGAVALQLVNFTTGAAAAVAFPETDAGAEQNYDITDLAFSDGDRLGLYYASGTRVLADVEVTVYL